jgi:cytosine deaminase
MTSREAIAWSFEAVTKLPAEVMGLEGYGLEIGANADMVVLQATDPIEAVRMRPARIAVIRSGKVIARTAPRMAELSLEGRPATLDPATYAPPSLR